MVIFFVMIKLNSVKLKSGLGVFLILLFLFPAVSVFADNGADGQTGSHTGNPVNNSSGRQVDGRTNNRDSEKDEFVIAFSPGSFSLDPLHLYTTVGLQIATGIYEGLVTYNPFTMEPIPGTAERWTISDDGLTYKFYLRDDSVYSNGAPVTAEDFRDSWLRMLEPGNKAEYSFLFDIIEGAADYRKGKTSDPDKVGIKAVSDKELDVKLNKPASHFLKVLCHTSFVPLYKKYTEDKNWNGSGVVIGNGPFLLYKRTKDEIVLKKNMLYWDKKNVRMDTIKILFSDDVKEISREFNRGEIQWADDWDSDLIKDTSKIVAHPLFGTTYFFFVSNKSPWNDYRVRRGLALLIPWETLRKDNSILPTATLVPSIPGYPKIDGITKRNDKEAMSLLKDAGYPDGKGLPPIIFKISDSSGTSKIVKAMTDVWNKKLSADVRVEKYPYKEYLKELKKDDYTLGSATWIGDFADPLTFLQLWMSGGNLNDAKFSNKNYDEIIEKSYSEKGIKRYKSLSEAEKMLLNGAVVLPLSNPPSFNLIDLESVGGWFPNPLNIHPLKYLYYKTMTLPPGIAMVK